MNCPVTADTARYYNVQDQYTVEQNAIDVLASEEMALVSAAQVAQGNNADDLDNLLVLLYQGRRDEALALFAAVFQPAMKEEAASYAEAQFRNMLRGA